MTPRKESTPAFVRSVLKIPDNVDGIFDTLSGEQRLGMILMRMAEDQEEMRVYGCAAGVKDRERIERLEKSQARFVGAVTLFLSLGGVAGLCAIFKWLV